MKYFDSEEKREIATRIQNYIDQNKWKLNLTTSVSLQPVIYKRGTTETYNLQDEQERLRYFSYINVLKKKNILRFTRPTPNSPRELSVNPAFLDKTGVINHIPLKQEQTVVKKPIVMPPALEEEKIRQQAVSFIEEEMKKIQISLAVVRYAGASLEMTDLNLYQLYKIATSIDNVCEKTVESTTSNTTALPPEKNDDSEEKIETDDSQFEFSQTETASEVPF